MELALELPDGSFQAVSGAPQESIKTLKERIASKFGFQMEDVLLQTLNGEAPLENEDATLEDCLIEENDMLKVLHTPPAIPHYAQVEAFPLEQTTTTAGTSGEDIFEMFGKNEVANVRQEP